MIPTATLTFSNSAFQHSITLYDLLKRVRDIEQRVQRLYTIKCQLELPAQPFIFKYRHFNQYRHIDKVNTVNTDKHIIDVLGEMVNRNTLAKIGHTDHVSRRYMRYTLRYMYLMELLRYYRGTLCFALEEIALHYNVDQVLTTFGHFILFNGTKQKNIKPIEKKYIVRYHSFVPYH